jgi:hypothetical protein
VEVVADHLLLVLELEMLVVVPEEVHGIPRE